MADPTFDPFTDPEYQTLFNDAKAASDTFASNEAEIKRLQAIIDTYGSDITPQNNPQAFAIIGQAKVLQAANDELKKQLPVLTAKRDNRFALASQGWVNSQAGTAGAGAVKSQNLLATNINANIQGSIALNNSQAADALLGIGQKQQAVVGRQSAKAGQAGYSASSGTLGALADAAATASDADQAAIEGYRVGTNNLLTQQSTAAMGAATAITGAINKTTTDWQDKSLVTLTDVTDTRMTNVNTAVAASGFTGDMNTPGITDSNAAVDTALDTWDYASYMETLNTLTGHSANQATWDQMMSSQGVPPINPYSQYSSTLAPLAPVSGGIATNLLAAATNTPDVYTSTLSGKKNNTGRLI